MLVLTRKANEQIQIGDGVVITILRIKGQSVRIGIEAPRDVLVLRSELPKFDHEAADRQTTQGRRMDMGSLPQEPCGTKNSMEKPRNESLRGKNRISFGAGGRPADSLADLYAAKRGGTDPVRGSSISRFPR